jgi:D-glycero-alpha-D-manno-heptose-7-phosphate kinase
MIISRTPFRVSFFGGGTDYPAWYLENGGAVLGMAIDKYCYISCRYLPPFFEHRYRIVYSENEQVTSLDDIKHPAVRAILKYRNCNQGLEIHHDGDLPARSGLGSSSSFSVGLINALAALEGRRLSHSEAALEALHVEQEVIGEAVGSQDQIFAAFGGFNFVEFKEDGSFDVAPVVLPKSRRDELVSHLMLFFTGISRFAPAIAKSKIENFGARTAELHKMRGLVDEALEILESDKHSISEFGGLLHDSWLFKKSLSEKVSNAAIDEIYDAGREAGAIGGKLLGAGGGGFMLFFVPPARQDAVAARLKPLVHVPFQISGSGSKIVLYQPDGLD